MFTKATKAQARARVAIPGTSGSGKTFTALTLANALKGDGKIALLDSERGSAAKYSDVFDFYHHTLTTYECQKYIDAIHAADAGGYTVLVIDSLSHAWSGIGGALDQVDKAKARSSSHNSFDAWRTVTPMHNALIDAILGSKCHIIATMRVKTEYVVEENERGKRAPKKIGLAPIQRDGMEYEFDVVAEMNDQHQFIVTKTRCPALTGMVLTKPKAADFKPLVEWLSDGSPVAEQPAVVEPKPAPSDVKRMFTADVCRWTNMDNTDPAIKPVLAGIAKAAGVKLTKDAGDDEWRQMAAWLSARIVEGTTFEQWKGASK